MKNQRLKASVVLTLLSTTILTMTADARGSGYGASAGGHTTGLHSSYLPVAGLTGGRFGGYVSLGTGSHGISAPSLGHGHKFIITKVTKAKKRATTTTVTTTTTGK